MAGQWDTMDRRLNQFIDLHRREAIPDSAAYELLDLAHRLQTREDDPHHQALQEAMQKEALRILGRKRAERGLKALDAATFKALEDIILDSDVSIDQLADELIVARVFADAADLTGPVMEKEEIDADLDS